MKPNAPTKTDAGKAKRMAALWRDTKTKVSVRTLARRMPEKRFRWFWADCCAIAARCDSASVPRDSHPAGYDKRFEALRSAIQRLRPEDAHRLTIELSGDADVPDLQTAFVIRRALPAMARAAESLSRADLNPPNRPRAEGDRLLSEAAACWRWYTGRPCSVNEHGSFAQFARVLLDMADPSRDHTDAALRRRIGKAVKSPSWRAACFPSIDAAALVYRSRPL